MSVADKAGVPSSNGWLGEYTGDLANHLPAEDTLLNAPDNASCIAKILILYHRL